MKSKILAMVFLLPLMINLLVFNSTELGATATTVNVTGVTLSEDELFFDRIGQTQTVSAIIQPALATNRNITFTSSNDVVATVNQMGLVTAKSNGIAQITVTTEDGGHTAVTSVRVESFFVENISMQILDDNGNTRPGNLFFEDEIIDIIVTVAPREAMGSDVPFTHVTNQSVIQSPTFEHLDDIVDDIHGPARRFRSRIKTLDVGITTINAIINELPTGVLHTASSQIEVISSAEGGGIRFLFNGQTFFEDRPLITTASTIPLQVTTREDLDIDLDFFLTNEENIDHAIIDRENNVINFLTSGVVELNFTSTMGSGSVTITSTMGRIDEASFDNLQLMTNDTIPLYLGMAEQIAFSIVPNDFETYYSVNWTSSPGINLTEFTSTNVLISAPQFLQNQWVQVEFSHEDGTENRTFRFHVDIVNFGIDTIFFDLNNEEVFIRGLEQTYVFGNMTHMGADFEHQINSITQGQPGAVHALEFHSDNTNLATVVNNTGLIRFSRDYEGFKPVRNESGHITYMATVTITAIAVYPPPRGGSEDRARTQYTFIIVRGANVSTLQQYFDANQRNLDIVLHRNISFENAFTTSVSLFGNGFIVDAHSLTDRMNSSTHGIFSFFNRNNFINNNKTLISNVTFSGFADNIDTAGFNVLATKGALLTLSSNTTLQYSVLQNAAILLNIDVDVVFDGRAHANENIHIYSNILRDAGVSGAFLGSLDANGSVTDNIVFEDIIFENTLTGILFHPAEYGENIGTFVFDIQGTLKFYNWIEKSRLDGLNISISGLILQADSFGFETVLDENNVELVLLSIVILEALRTNGTYFAHTTAQFTLNTASLLGEILSSLPGAPNATPTGGTDFNVNVYQGNRTSIAGMMTIDLLMQVYNPRIDSERFFISPDAQNARFTSPIRDNSLVTRTSASA